MKDSSAPRRWALLASFCWVGGTAWSDPAAPTASSASDHSLVATLEVGAIAAPEIFLASDDASAEYRVARFGVAVGAGQLWQTVTDPTTQARTFGSSGLVISEVSWHSSHRGGVTVAAGALASTRSFAHLEAAPIVELGFEWQSAAGWLIRPTARMIFTGGALLPFPTVLALGRAF